MANKMPSAASKSSTKPQLPLTQAEWQQQQAQRQQQQAQRQQQQRQRQQQLQEQQQQKLQGQQQLQEQQQQKQQGQQQLQEQPQQRQRQQKLQEQQQQQQQQLQEQQQAPIDVANPIGRLQELAQKQFWPLPAYSFEGSNVRNPVLRQFFCTVRLRDDTVRASGFSKRQAKREAAATLLRCLSVSTAPNPSPIQTPKQSPKASCTGTNKCLDEADFQSLRASKRLQSAARAGAEVDGLFQGVRNRKAGAVLPAIEAPSTMLPGCRSASEQLTELGKVHHFGLQFLAQSKQQPNRCVLKLSTMPTIVVVAAGVSPADGKEQACFTALEYLSVLTRENCKK